MKKNILFALPLSALVIACAQQGTDQMAGCQTMSIPPACNGPPNNPKVNINVQSGLTVAPKNVCAKAGKTIEFMVTPNDTPIVVAILPKDPADTWLIGSNISDPGGFKVPVPAELPDDKYEYHIVATNGKCYDPRITVN